MEEIQLPSYTLVQNVSFALLASTGTQLQPLLCLARLSHRRDIVCSSQTLNALHTGMIYHQMISAALLDKGNLC